MIVILRVALGVLGLFIGWSAFQHWIGSPEMRQHYEASPLAARGQFLVAAAQTIAAVFLLWPRFQALAGFILGTILVAIAVSQVAVNGVRPPFWQPFILGMCAIALAALLRRALRRRVKSAV